MLCLGCCRCDSSRNPSPLGPCWPGYLNFPVVVEVEEVLELLGRHAVQQGEEAGVPYQVVLGGLHQVSLLVLRAALGVGVLCRVVQGVQRVLSMLLEEGQVRAWVPVGAAWLGLDS